MLTLPPLPIMDDPDDRNSSPPSGLPSVEPALIDTDPPFVCTDSCTASDIEPPGPVRTSKSPSVPPVLRSIEPLD